jgi:CRP-like cAMP-binding protein
MESNDDANTVRGCFLLRNASESTVSTALCGGTVKSYKKGSTIYEPDDYRRELGLILNGEIEVTKTPRTGGKFVMKSLTQGEVFGAAAVFNDSPKYVTRLTAMTDCRIIFFSQELLGSLMREDFKVAENYIAFLSGRIQFLNSKINGLLISDTDTAVRSWLSQSMEQEDGRYFVRLRVSISELAAMLHMGRASLYRAFDELEALGAISRRGKLIEILKPEEINAE